MSTASHSPPQVGETAAAPRRATLGELVDNLHVGIIELLAAPSGLEIEVGEIVIFDALEEDGLEAGDVILAVGVAPEERAAAGLVDRAARAGAAAVVFRTDAAAQHTELAARAGEAGVAVLAVPYEMTWSQLHSLLRTARTTVGTEDDRTPAGAPVGDLFSLANAVAAAVGGPVTIEDPHSAVLAYSSLDEPIDDARRRTILGRRVPDEWIRRLRDEGVFKRLWSSGEVVRLEFTDDPDVRPRIAMAVRAGGEILGSLWVAEGDRPLGKEAELALREAAEIAALHLIRHRAGEDLERRRRSDQLRAVLDGRMPPAVLAGALRVDPVSSVTVVAFAVEEEEGSTAGRTALAERAAGIIALHCEAFRRQAATVAIGGVVYVLLPHGDALEREAVIPFVTSVTERSAEALRGEMTAAVGATVAMTDVASSRTEADRVLQAMRVDGRERRVATLADVRSTAILLALRELAAQHPELRQGKLEFLASHDREKNTEYVPTLRAYLDAFGDVPRAAAAADVHPNTFRYRLRRLGELAGLDLEDPVERLVISLQLALADLG